MSGAPERAPRCSRAAGGEPSTLTRLGGGRLSPWRQPRARIAVHDLGQSIDRGPLLGVELRGNVDQEAVADVAARGLRAALGRSRLGRPLPAQPLDGAVLG